MIRRLCQLASCRKTFDVPEWKVKQGRGVFCSVACRGKASRTTNATFISKVNKHGPVHPVLKTRCWHWDGYVHGDGYGIIRVMKEGVPAHRKAWEVWRGVIPEGTRVLHKCDNRRCVNPCHLFLGTDSDNIRDRDQKLRQVKGEDSHLSKLTESQVLEIRRRYDEEVVTKGHTTSALATEFGVSRSQIRHIGKRWCWKHLPE